MCEASGRSATITSCSTWTAESVGWIFRSRSQTSFPSTSAGVESAERPSDTTAGGRDTWKDDGARPDRFGQVVGHSKRLLGGRGEIGRHKYLPDGAHRVSPFCRSSTKGMGNRQSHTSISLDLIGARFQSMSAC
jgi:hypothetical protein